MKIEIAEYDGARVTSLHELDVRGPGSPNAIVRKGDEGKVVGIQSEHNRPLLVKFHDIPCFYLMPDEVKLVALKKISTEPELATV